MNRAAPILQEVAVRRARNSQPQSFTRAIDVSFLEGARRHAQELGCPRQVLFRQPDEPPLRATFGTSGLALKSQRLRHSIIMARYVNSLYRKVAASSAGESAAREYRGMTPATTYPNAR